MRGKILSVVTNAPLLTLFFLLTGLTASGHAQSPSAASPAQGPPTAEHAYKNIQVLKNIPANQLIPSMQFITASLGVECGFCHVENHFDQDDKKPKLIARKMMLMMMAINQNNFDGHRQVTCDTCHRGARAPVAIPEISEGPPAPRMQAEEPLPANLPTADVLINKYVQALGGEKAIAGISSLEESGTASFFGREMAVTIYDKTPSKRASVMHLPNGDTATVFNGETGWTGSPGHPPREMPISEVEGEKIDADLQFPLHIRQVFPDLRPGRPENIEGHDAYQLVSENSGQPRIRLYFDQQTGLLLRMTRYSDSPLGLNPVRLDYSDYRPVNGVQVPYRWTVARPSGQFTVQVTEIKPNVEIDDAKFAKPPGPEQAQSKP